MRDEWAAEYQKAKELTSALGCRVTVTEGKHRGEEGFLISVTQPEFKHPMCDSPDDPPPPYAEIDWFDVQEQRYIRDIHHINEVELLKLKPLI